MQAWFRADAELTETSHQVFGNYFRDTSGSSVSGGFFNLAAQPGSAGFYGLTLEYQSAGGAHVHASVLDGATPDARLEIGRWYHLAAQRDVEAGEARVFVDGVLKLQDTNVGYPARELDWTGVDSLLAPFVSLCALFIAQALLPDSKHPWFTPGGWALCPPLGTKRAYPGGHPLPKGGGVGSTLVPF